MTVAQQIIEMLIKRYIWSAKDFRARGEGGFEYACVLGVCRLEKLRNDLDDSCEMNEDQIEELQYRAGSTLNVKEALCADEIKPEFVHQEWMHEMMRGEFAWHEHPKAGAGDRSARQVTKGTRGYDLRRI